MGALKAHLEVADNMADLELRADAYDKARKFVTMLLESVEETHAPLMASKNAVEPRLPHLVKADAACWHILSEAAADSQVTRMLLRNPVFAAKLGLGSAGSMPLGLGPSQGRKPLRRRSGQRRR